MNNKSAYIDVHVMSRLPNMAEELKKALPVHVNLITVPVADMKLKWDKSIKLNENEKNAVKNCEILVADSMFVGKLLYELPHVKWVQSTWAGVELIFEQLDKSKPLPKFKLTRYVDPYFEELMSNYVMGQIINLERGFYYHNNKQNTHEWSRPYFPNYRVLSDLTVGVLGSGTIGSTIGRQLKNAGSYVIAYVKNPRNSPSQSYNKAITDLNAILEECDYIVNALPSTEQTKGILDNDILKKCKKKPVFINAGRGDIIKENNIIKALKNGWISKAVLDVFENEPLPSNSPLWNMPEVYITPHIGGIPRIDKIAQLIAKNYTRFINGEPLINEVEWNKGY